MHWVVSCGRRHLFFRVSGRHAQVRRVCACACSSWPGPAGRPPGRVLVRLTFPLAVLSFFLVRPPPGWGCACLGFSLVFFVFPFFPSPSPLSHPRCFRHFVLSGLGCPGLGALRLLLPPPFFFVFFVFLSPFPSCVSHPLVLRAPPVAGCGVLLFPAAGVPGLGVARFPPAPPFFFLLPPFVFRFPRCVGACCCPPLCFVLCVPLAIVLCHPCPLPSVRCCAACGGPVRSCCAVRLVCAVSGTRWSLVRKTPIAKRGLGSMLSVVDGSLAPVPWEDLYPAMVQEI